ncbi:hypothetical protein [Streptomyces leeuwenhoekii]|uniref:Sle1_114 protein n=1 Tax=Streptomyces leeuwenhoekii TaxID=1437453 RepID=A0A0F7VR49_STRLW|nr:hypothetical protein [Streptomyces leeuwenhoekii]CQR59281.1 sle1_114 [Streptomyces leeuwenhoekii]
MSPDEFAREFEPEFIPAQSGYIPAAGPYGHPVQPVQPGLTKRGKAALAIGATVIVGGGFLAWQNHAEQAAANEIRAQELAVRQQQIELEKMKELNKANVVQQKTQETLDAERQKQIDACVKTNKDLVGKQLGITYSRVLDDCQARFGTVNDATSAGMQEAASTSDSGDGGISPTVLLAIAAGGSLIVGVAANRGRKTNAA